MQPCRNLGARRSRMKTKSGRTEAGAGVEAYRSGRVERSQARLQRRLLNVEPSRTETHAGQKVLWTRPTDHLELLFAPAEVHAHIRHPHRHGGGASLWQCAKVHCGRSQLEGSERHLCSPQRTCPTPSPGLFLHYLGLEHGLVWPRADGRAEDARRQPDLSASGLPGHVHTK